MQIFTVIFHLSKCESTSFSDEDLEKVDMYADRQESLLSSLSELSRAAGEKWEWLLKKRNKDFNNKDFVNLKADQADQAILNKCKCQ